MNLCGKKSYHQTSWNLESTQYGYISKTWKQNLLKKKYDETKKQLELYTGMVK